MDVLNTQLFDNTDETQNNITSPSCPNCRALQKRFQEVKAQLELKSLQFTEAIAQLTSNQRARSQAQQLDEKFIEQCIREKTEAQIELKKRAKQLEQFKANDANKNNKLLRQIHLLKKQSIKEKQDCQCKIAQINENARHDAARYEEIISKLKIDSMEAAEAARDEVRDEFSDIIEESKQLEKQNLQLKLDFQHRLEQAELALKRKSQEHEHSMAQLKNQFEKKLADLTKQAQKIIKDKDAKSITFQEQLSQVSEQVAVSSRAKARAEQLNQRLVEQCSMAKSGADVEVEMKTKQFTEDIARIKSQAAAKFKAVSEQNAQLKAQAANALSQAKNNAEALKRANERMKLLEQALVSLKNASLVGQQF